MDSYEIKRQDMRKMRAVSMASAIMSEMEDILGKDADVHEIYRRLVDILSVNGAAWTTDEERRVMGLEPRDDLGWTASEIVRDREARRALMVGLMRTPTISQATMDLLKDVRDKIDKVVGIPPR